MEEILKSVHIKYLLSENLIKFTFIDQICFKLLFNKFLKDLQTIQ